MNKRALQRVVIGKAQEIYTKHIELWHNKRTDYGLVPKDGLQAKNENCREVIQGRPTEIIMLNHKSRDDMQIR